LFQVSVEPGFSLLYCGIYGVLVGLESIAPETARKNVEMNVWDGLPCSWAVLERMGYKHKGLDR